MVVVRLARIFDKQAKVRNVFIRTIFTVFNGIGSLDWTYHGNPSRWLFCFKATYVWCFVWHTLKATPRTPSISITNSFKIFLPVIYNLTSMVFKLDSWKYISPIIIRTTQLIHILIEALHLCDDHFTFYLKSFVLFMSLKTNFECILFIFTVCHAILGLLCSLLKWIKNYCSIILLRTLIKKVFIIREFECWVSRHPGIWECCEVGGYQWISGFYDTRDKRGTERFTLFPLRRFRLAPDC